MSPRVAVSTAAVAALAAIVVVILAGAGSAAAHVSLSWSEPVSVDQPRSYVDPTAIEQLSCPSASLCAAVDADGSVLTSSDPAAGAASWRRTRFPPRASGQLQALSCPSRALCIGVDLLGRVHTTTDPTGGAGAWRVVQLRADAGGLRSISCPSVRLCVALSDGGRVVTSTLPTGGAAAWRAVRALHGPELTAVSCASLSLCVAVTSDGSVAVSSDPTGGPRSWRVSRVAKCLVVFDDPRYGRQCPAFTGVSCPSMTECVAVDDVGQIASSTDPTGGSGAWHLAAVLPFPGSAPPPPVLLRGIACPTVSLCVAALGGVPAGTVTNLGALTTGGGVLTSADPTGPISAWSAAGIAGADPLAVACPLASLCVTAGLLGEVAASSDPLGGSGAWSAGAIDGADALVAVSCPTRSFCAAVDDGGRALLSDDPTRPKARWRVNRLVALPTAIRLRPPGYPPEEAISCATASLCVAVGSDAGAVASRRRGRWSVSVVPALAGSTGVACPSPSLCVAVDGDYVLSSTHPTGGAPAWRYAALDPNITLKSVACPSPRLCVATGFDGGAPPSFAFNRGDLLVSTNPAGGPHAWRVVRPHATGDIAAVSCASVQFCVAASDNGLLSSTHPARGLRAWRLHRLKDSQDISALSCPGRALCVGLSAVNAITYGDPIHQHAWRLVTIGAGEPINGVSCPSTQTCIAVGNEGTVTTSRTRPAPQH